jgi:hypothetical protein
MSCAHRLPGGLGEGGFPAKSRWRQSRSLLGALSWFLGLGGAITYPKKRDVGKCIFVATSLPKPLLGFC